MLSPRERAVLANITERWRKYGIQTYYTEHAVAELLAKGLVQLAHVWGQGYIPTELGIIMMPRSDADA